MCAYTTRGKCLLCVVGVIAAAGALVGCPTPSTYDTGYNAGFAKDDWYWTGYFDGYDTTDADPIYYYTDDIPYLDDNSYDAGYWDGVWAAYNDGYFVDYRYAFIIGFSEGYDNAFWEDYLDFLATDQHSEYLNGGWGDGYNDGFSEGRVFGAYDYETGLDFDWEDALADYESGTDLYFEEVDVGTGEWGPVYLYEYGTDPRDLAKAARPSRASVLLARSVRSAAGAEKAQAKAQDLFRTLRADARETLDIKPAVSLRSDRALDLKTTWLERVESYLSIDIQKAAREGASRTGRVPPAPALLSD